MKSPKKTVIPPYRGSFHTIAGVEIDTDLIPEAEYKRALYHGLKELHLIGEIDLNEYKPKGDRR